MTKIRFTKDISLEVADGDRRQITNENFLKGETDQCNILNATGRSVDLEFGDGSMAYAIPKNAFESLN